MELTRAIAICVIAASFGLGAAVHAQSLKNVDMPSEFPPASYKGKQYVDSRGCVYIRAGVDGNVTWVPRMTRDRKVICGYKPSIANAAPNTSSAAKLDKNVVVIQPAAAPTTTSTTTTAAAKSKSKPKSTTTTAAAPKPKSTTTTTTAATTTATTKPKSNTNSWWNWTTKPSTSTTTTTTAAPKPTTTTTAVPPATTTTTTTTSTTNNNTRRSLDQSPRQTGFDSPCRSGVKSTLTVRCGPQSQLPYTPGTGNPTAPAPRIIINRQGASLFNPPVGTIVREGEVASNVRVIPLHLYENRQFAMNTTEVPQGYRRVFEDGRLNPFRAEQTFAGKAAMDAVWEETTPRKLLNDTEGAVVVSTKSIDQSSDISTNAPVISTKSASDEKALRLAGQAYVQVQTYSDSAAAQSAAKNVRAMGMPAKIGKYSRDGETYRIVLAGPYTTADQADSAAKKAHGAGYSDAFVRN